MHHNTPEDSPKTRRSALVPVFALISLALVAALGAGALFGDRWLGPALERENLFAARLLLRLNPGCARPEAGPLGHVLLDKALREKREEAALLLLRSGARYNKYHEINIASFATAYDFEAIAEYLLKNIANDNKAAFLHLSIYNNRIDFVEKILRSGANPNALVPATSYAYITTFSGLDKNAAPLFLSLRHDVKITTLLLDFGTKTDILDENKMTPLHWAAAMNPKTIQYLINSGSNIEAKDNFGMTPLHIAARNNFDSTKIILSKKPNIESRDNLNVTPFLSLVTNLENGDMLPEQANLLLEAGADPNAHGLDGIVALHWAAHIDSIEMIKWLLEVGANSTLKDDSGQAPIDVATSEPVKALLREAMAAHEASQASGAGSGSAANSK